VQRDRKTKRKTEMEMEMKREMKMKMKMEGKTGVVWGRFPAKLHCSYVCATQERARQR